MTLGRVALVAAAAFLAAALAPAPAATHEGPACAVTDAEYDVSANRRITGTMLGAGDGEHRIGPGRIALRFDRRPPPATPDGVAVRMTSYELRETFAVVATALFWKTQVKTDIRTWAAAGPRAIVAEGILTGRTLRWTTVDGVFRTDGTLDCQGFFCGKFGAPPSGTSELHMGPGRKVFGPFAFAADMKTFEMASTLDSKEESPAEVSYLALAAREMRRACVAP